jgi:FkbM family methyltransferase
MKLSFEHGDQTIELECFDNGHSRRICNRMLAGQVYPAVSFVSDVKVVMDVGAYVGDSSLYFSLLYPDAEIFAFEPGPASYRLLEKNTSTRSNVHPYDYGLFSSDRTVPLYKGAGDASTSSVSKSRMTSADSESVRLRSVRDWLSEHEIAAVDVLKIDTEGCEIPIMQSMRELLPSVKIAHLEFHSEDDRKEIDRLLGDTHVLVAGKMLFQTGVVTYVATDALPVEQALGQRDS